MSRSQQRPLGKGGGSLEGLGPDWGTIWVALEWNTIPSGAGQERVRVHTLEIFLNHRPLFLSWGVDLGRRGYNAESSFSRGDTPPPPHSAGGDQTNKGWFFFFPCHPKGRHYQSEKSKSLLSSSTSQPPAPGNSDWKKKKKKNSKTLFAWVWDWRALISQAEADGKGGGGEAASEKRGRGGGFFLHGPIPHPVTPVPGTRRGPGAVQGRPSPQAPG